MNEREKTDPISNVNKINQSSIIDKIHSIQASLNTNNKSKLEKKLNIIKIKISWRLKRNKIFINY